MKTKRSFSTLLIVCLMLAILPAASVPAWAASMEVSTWAELQAALSAGGDIVLTADVIPDKPYWANPLDVPSGVTAKLDLNGHIVDRGYNADMTNLYGSVFKISGTLTVTDSDPAADHGRAVAYTDPITGGTVEVTGGVITGGFHDQFGGGVYITGGTFNLEGGSIACNGAGKNGFGAVEGLGGGVYMQSGTFNMSGGAVVGNRAVNKNIMVSDMQGKGGGVYVSDGTFTLSGGTVSGNEAGRCGGGVYLASTYSGHSGSLVSGGATVTGNAVGGADNNVYLEDGGVLSVTDTLTGTVGVTMMTPGVFTSGLSGRGTADNFVSDDADYIVSLTDAGEAQLKAEEYPLWVGGVQITSLNKGDITAAITAAGGTASGSAAYDPDRNTLTLTDFSYTGLGYNFSATHYTAFYYSSTTDLTIEFSGVNSITQSDYAGTGKGMYFVHPPANQTDSNNTIIFHSANGGTLNVTGGSSTGFESNGIEAAKVHLVISGGTINATGGLAKYKSYGVLCSGTSTLTVDGGTLNAVGGNSASDRSRGVYCIGDYIAVKSGKLTASGGTSGVDKSRGIEGFSPEKTTLSVTGGELIATGLSQANLDTTLSVGEGMAAKGSVTGNEADAVPYITANNDSYKWIKIEKLPEYNVTVIPGANMTKTTASGAVSQTVAEGSAIAGVIYTADENYYFPTDYSVAAVNGITVTRDSWTQITVSGTPTADTTINLAAATAKMKEDKPTAVFTATGPDSGTLTNVTAGMTYAIDSGAAVEITGTSVDLIGLAPCAITVIQPGNGTTTIDSDAQTITITKAETPMLTATQPSAIGGTGSISTTAAHEFSEDGTTWKDCTGETDGLAAGTYYVRAKAADTVLASEAQEIEITAFVPTQVPAPYIPTTYTAAVVESEHGTVTVTPKTAAEGAKVTISVTPDEGYEVDTVTVLTKDGREIRVTGNEDGAYFYTQPYGDVTVRVVYRVSAAPFANPFIDVPEGSYFYDAVMWGVQNGITEGTNGNTFRPDMPCTRAQMVTFLWRAAGKPEPATTKNPFADLDENAYYYKAVLWAYENGITLGAGDGKFDPDGIVTRAQSVTFLFRALHGSVASGNRFTDVDPDAYYYEAVLWAAKNGITLGTGDGMFSPDDDCLRAQIMTFLYRAYHDD